MADAIKVKDFEKAMSYRDPEFCDNLDGFHTVSELFKEKRLPPEKRMRIAIMQ